MAKNNNLTDFLTDVANAIREKDGSTGTINPQNFSDKIKAIQTGVDTSDGNIEPTTVLKGYKGYAKGVAVNGAIETYDGTVEDVDSGLLFNSSWKLNQTIKPISSDTFVVLVNSSIRDSANTFNSNETAKYANLRSSMCYFSVFNESTSVNFSRPGIYYWGGWKKCTTTSSSSEEATSGDIILSIGSCSSDVATQEKFVAWLQANGTKL